MKQAVKLFVLAALGLFVSLTLNAQMTTSSLSGKITDAQGVAVYENMEERSDYKASVTMYPEGYEQLGDIVDHYLDGATEVTITVKAVA